VRRFDEARRDAGAVGKHETESFDSSRLPLEGHRHVVACADGLRLVAHERVEDLSIDL
jgi:hypothetical protein